MTMLSEKDRSLKLHFSPKFLFNLFSIIFHRCGWPFLKLFWKVTTKKQYKYNFTITFIFWWPSTTRNAFQKAEQSSIVNQIDDYWSNAESFDWCQKAHSRRIIKLSCINKQFNQVNIEFVFSQNSFLPGKYIIKIFYNRIFNYKKLKESQV